MKIALVGALAMSLVIGMTSIVNAEPVVHRGNPPGHTVDGLSTTPQQDNGGYTVNPRISSRNIYASPMHYYMEEFYPMDVYGMNTFHALAHFVRTSLHVIHPGVLTDAAQGLEGWSYQIIVTDGTGPDHVDRRFEFFVQSPLGFRHFEGYAQFGSNALYWVTLREVQ